MLSIGLAAIIALLAIPRVTGASWRSIITPMDMRELDGMPVQYEANRVLRSVHAMLTPDTPGEVLIWFSTDEYRALLPIHVGSIFTRLFSSFYWGSLASELLWWWAGSVATMLLARRLGHRWTTAAVAGALTAGSPVAVAHIGAAHLHTASSMALPVATLIAWDALHDARGARLGRTMVVGFAIFLSSVVYTYQWVLIPWLLGLAVVVRAPRRWLIDVMLGAGWFLVASSLSHGLLSMADITVHPQQNDPLRALGYHFDSTRPTARQENVVLAYFDAFAWPILQRVPGVAIGMWHDYHPSIWILAVVGVVMASRVQQAWLLVATALAFAHGSIYGVAWVIMSAFPLVYISSAGGIVAAASLVQRASRSLPISMLRPVLGIIFPSTVLLVTVMAMLSTNLDLLGMDAFVIRWWGGWPVPH